MAANVQQAIQAFQGMVTIVQNLPGAQKGPALTGLIQTAAPLFQAVGQNIPAAPQARAAVPVVNAAAQNIFANVQKVDGISSGIAALVQSMYAIGEVGVLFACNNKVKALLVLGGFSVLTSTYTITDEYFDPKITKTSDKGQYAKQLALKIFENSGQAVEKGTYYGTQAVLFLPVKMWHGASEAVSESGFKAAAKTVDHTSGLALFHSTDLIQQILNKVDYTANNLLGIKSPIASPHNSASAQAASFSSSSTPRQVPGQTSTPQAVQTSANPPPPVPTPAPAPTPGTVQTSAPEQAVVDQLIEQMVAIYNNRDQLYNTTTSYLNNKFDDAAAYMHNAYATKKTEFIDWGSAKLPETKTVKTAAAVTTVVGLGGGSALLAYRYNKLKKVDKVANEVINPEKALDVSITANTTEHLDENKAIVGEPSISSSENSIEPDSVIAQGEVVEAGLHTSEDPIELLSSVLDVPVA